MTAESAQRLYGRPRPTECIDNIANGLHALVSNRFLDVPASPFSHAELGAAAGTADQNADMPDTTASQLKLEFGARLKMARTALGYTSAALAAAGIGVDENTYTMWERGERYPNAVNLLKIKRGFGVTVDYLYFGDRQGLSTDLVRLLNAAERNSA